MKNKSKYQKPIVDICIPVFNGEHKISRVIDSILSQSFQNFKLLISDNNSNDNTENIIKRYLSLDSRIEYYRQKKNIGAEGNFKYLFNKSESKYFMWAAADDIRSSNYLELNIRFLENNRDYVASTLQTRFEGGSFNEQRMGDKALIDDSPEARIRKHLSVKWCEGIHANGRFYSVIRRDSLRDVIKKEWNYLGADWMIVAHLLSIGKINRINDGWMELGRYGASNSQDLFAAYRKSVSSWIMPFSRLSTDIWKIIYSSNGYHKALIVLKLINLNLYGFIIQFYIKFKRRL
jgi:glycosyltransferase involved in cell wall biosynthesis